jgi:hypothetical protein
LATEEEGGGIVICEQEGKVWLEWAKDLSLGPMNKTAEGPSRKLELGSTIGPMCDVNRRARPGTCPKNYLGARMIDRKPF